MSHTGKKVCLIVSIVFSLLFFALAIYFAVQTVALRNKINDALKFDYGTGGTLVTPPAAANSIIIKSGTVNVGQLVLYRWDHVENDKTLTHLYAVLDKTPMKNGTNTTLGLCVSGYTEPTLADVF